MGEKRLSIRIVKGEGSPVFEYFCSKCKQLRLSFVVTDRCANCGNTEIIKGKLGTLRKES